MEMQKAYDKDVLVKALKDAGIGEAEKMAKSFVVVLADWLRSSAHLSSEGIVGKFDDFAIPGINYFEKLALEKLDGLDGKAEPAPVSVASAEVAVEASSSELG